jgi:protein-L-isoaspartate O-methyltransferase
VATKKEKELLRKLKKEGRLVVPRGALPDEVREAIKDTVPKGTKTAR